MSFERRKVRTGIVVSDKMDKTLVVVIEWRRLHPIYRKSVKRQTRLMVHDPENSAKYGDTVRVRESRPISKTKRWRLIDVLTRADIAEIQPEEIAVDEDVLVAPRETPADQLPSGVEAAADADETDLADDVVENVVMLNEDEASEEEGEPEGLDAFEDTAEDIAALDEDEESEEEAEPEELDSTDVADDIDEANAVVDEAVNEPQDEATEPDDADDESDDDEEKESQ